MYGYNEHTFYGIVKMEQEIKELFSRHEKLQPSFTVNFVVYHHKIEVSQYMEVTVYVSDVDEVPHSFIMGVEDAIRSTLGAGYITINVEPIIDDEEQYDFWEYEDVWDSNLAVWEQEVGGDPSRLTYHYPSTPEEDRQAKKVDWPYYGNIYIETQRSEINFEQNGNNKELGELGKYKHMVENLNKVLRYFNEDEIDYKVIKAPNTHNLISKLKSDIEVITESITKQGKGYLSNLYSGETHEVHRELVLYYDVGLKNAYFSYNAVGYNYQWNTATPDVYKYLNFAAYYRLNDLSWRGLSHRGWLNDESSGRCVRTLHEELGTYKQLQGLFEEELGSLFTQQEWSINRGDGSGVIFTMDVLAKGPITTIKESYKGVMYLNKQGQVVARLSGYKKLNIEEGKVRLDALRQKLGII